MPEVSRFYGIVIQIFFRDHEPPHFHAKCGSHDAVIDIEDVAINRGDLPRTARRLVLEWAALHRDELLVAWKRARRGEAPGRIPPLD